MLVKKYAIQTVFLIVLVGGGWYLISSFSFSSENQTENKERTKSEWFTETRWLTDREIDWAFTEMGLGYDNNNWSFYKTLPAYQFNYVKETKGINEANAYLAFPELINAINTADCEVLFIPVNNPDFHWSLLVYNTYVEEFYHFDTLRGANYEYAKPLVKELLQQIHQNNDVDLDKYFIKKHDISQKNGHDCGVAVISIAKKIIEQEIPVDDIDFSNLDFQKERKYWREEYLKKSPTKEPNDLPNNLEVQKTELRKDILKRLSYFTPKNILDREGFFNSKGLSLWGNKKTWKEYLDTANENNFSTIKENLLKPLTELVFFYLLEKGTINNIQEYKNKYKTKADNDYYQKCTERIKEIENLQENGKKFLTEIDSYQAKIANRLIFFQNNFLPRFQEISWLYKNAYGEKLTWNFDLQAEFNRTNKLPETNLEYLRKKASALQNVLNNNEDIKLADSDPNNSNQLKKELGKLTTSKGFREAIRAKGPNYEVNWEKTNELAKKYEISNLPTNRKDIVEGLLWREIVEKTLLIHDSDSWFANFISGREKSAGIIEKVQKLIKDLRDNGSDYAKLLIIQLKQKVYGSIYKYALKPNDKYVQEFAEKVSRILAEYRQIKVEKNKTREKEDLANFISELFRMLYFRFQTSENPIAWKFIDNKTYGDFDSTLMEIDFEEYEDGSMTVPQENERLLCHFPLIATEGNKTISFKAQMTLLNI